MTIETVRAQVAAWTECGEIHSLIHAEESARIQHRRQVTQQNNLVHGHNWGHHVG